MNMDYDMHSHTPMPATQSTGAVQPATNELATLQAKKKTVRKKKASSATATPTVTPAPPSLPPNLAQMSTSEFQAAIYELVLRQATALESVSFSFVCMGLNHRRQQLCST